MPEVSIDEFLNSRKDFVKSGDVLVKASRVSPSSWNEELRSVQFVMSAEIEDRDRDIIVQEGLDTTEFLKNPIAFYNHSSRDFPVGTWGDIVKSLSGRPKRTEGVLTLAAEGEEPLADRLAKHIAGGRIRACSIGFLPKQVERREVPEDKRGEQYYYPGFRILSAELVECSAVSIPANPAALAKAAADGDVMAADVISDVLDNWAKHPETGLLIPRSDFEAAHKAASGNKTSVVLKTPEPVPPEPAEHGLFRRFLSFVAGDGVKLDVEHASRVVEAEKAAAAMETTALQERFTALEKRLAAKGI